LIPQAPKDKAPEQFIHELGESGTDRVKKQLGFSNEKKDTESPSKNSSEPE
jgi:hypothetical protein